MLPVAFQNRASLTLLFAFAIKFQSVRLFEVLIFITSNSLIIILLFVPKLILCEFCSLAFFNNNNDSYELHPCLEPAFKRSFYAAPQKSDKIFT
jgi:hypothetical protein